MKPPAEVMKLSRRLQKLQAEKDILVAVGFLSHPRQNPDHSLTLDPLAASQPEDACCIVSSCSDGHVSSQGACQQA